MKLTQYSQRNSIMPHVMAEADDFIGLDTTKWNTIDADSGASVAHDANGVNGIVLLTTGATDNNEAYLYSNEIILPAANRTIAVQARIQYAEANTDDANVLFGLMDAVAANHLQDDGAGPVASYDGAVLFKVDGGTRWQAESSNATTQKTTDTKQTAGGSSFQTLCIQITDEDDTNFKVDFFIDPSGGQNLQPLYEYDGQARQQPVSHLLAKSGLAGEMAIVVAAKAGDTNSEVISVDYTAWEQTR